MASTAVRLTPTRSTTRKQTEIWLVGYPSGTLNATKLPSKKEVMSLFMHYKSVAQQTIREASQSTAVDVIAVWEKARIPIRLKKHVVDKVESLFREWEKLKKNKGNKAKRSETLRQKEQKWKEDLEHLFDIAHADAMKLIQIEEDRDFLNAQREKGRRGKMGSVDTTLAKKEEESKRRQHTQEKRRLEEEVKKKQREEKVSLASSSESETELETINTEDEEDAFCEPGPSPSTSMTQSSKRRKLMDDKLSVSLDMAKLSDRKAALVLTPTIQSLGHNPTDYSVSFSSIRRERLKRRQKIAENLKREFKPSVPLTIHWDGKLLEDITGRETVDRLPILVSGEGVDQLLSVPKLQSGTGHSTASAVYEASVSWGICNRIKCMSFDTTAANTGPRNGACILLEQKMEKDMLWLACRHHVLEIMLEAVVTTASQPSKGPEIMLFKRFRNKWSTINQSEYGTALSDELTANELADITDDTIAFASNQLETFQPRDDYRELLELTIIFLGGEPPRGVSFKAPAGLHRARWMAKAIYCLKIWMFKSQFRLTSKEERGLRDICVFVLRLYVKVWFTATAASSAPRQDLQLLKDLDKYRDRNISISAVALKKFLGHLWYLSEELIALAFFDDNVSADTKSKMVMALQTPGDEHPLKRITLDPALIQAKTLEHFVTSNTRRFFEITGLPSNFLNRNVQDWENDEMYNSVKTTVHNMRVVNDIAERGVALMDEYNKLLTNDEKQKQYLLLVVKNYRQKYPDRKKETLMN